MVTVRVMVRVMVRVLGRVRVMVRVSVTVSGKACDFLLGFVRVRVLVRFMVRVRVMVIVMVTVILMPFSPPFPFRERILDIGPAGSGKTSNFLHIARFLSLTQSQSRFFIGDSDFAMEKMLISYPEVHPYVSLHPLYDWEDYIRFGQVVLQSAGPNDWVCIDFIGSAWKAVQEYYVAQVFQRGIGDYFLAARKKEVAELEGWVDWSVINPLYQQWIMPILFKCRAHLFATAKSEALSSGNKPTEGKDTRSLLLPFSVKPVGQKDLPFQFHTFLISDRDPQGRRLFSTVKDRERMEVRGQVVTDFAQDYLMAIAGWKVSA